MSKRNLDTMPKDIFRNDGTLRYITMAATYPLSGGIHYFLRVQVNQTKEDAYTLSIKLEDNILDAYKEAVDFLADYHSVNKRSKVYQAMLDSITEFKVRYDIRVALVTVVKQVIIPGNRYDGLYVPRGRFIKRESGKAPAFLAH